MAGRLTKEQLKEQILQIVLAQGNRFIKDLLRKKQIRIGTTKEDFRNNLTQAIDDGHLTADDIDEWLGVVEGWGNQQCYLYRVPDNFKKSQWSDENFVEKRVRDAGYGKLWHATTSLQFPEAVTLTAIDHTAERLSFIWHQGGEYLQRRQELDREASVSGDDIVFKAYSREWRRSVLRFEWRKDLELAALFVARSSDQGIYEKHRIEMISAVRPVIDIRKWDPVNVSTAITRLDELATKGSPPAILSKVQATSTMFRGASSWVRLGSNSRTASYQDDSAMRPVRSAVDTKQLIGGDGDYRLNLGSGAAVHAELYGRDQRILFWGAMRAEDVWQSLVGISQV